MGFATKELQTLNEEELIQEIRRISDSVHIAYPNGIYVLPIINYAFYEEAAKENDNRLYNQLLNKVIQPVTYSVYSLLNNQDMRVSQTIKMIKQNDNDNKFVSWLFLKLGSTFIKEITFDNTIKPEEPEKEVIEITTYDDSSIFLDYPKNNDANKHEIYISDDLKPAISPGFA